MLVFSRFGESLVLRRISSPASWPESVELCSPAGNFRGSLSSQVLNSRSSSGLDSAHSSLGDWASSGKPLCQQVVDPKGACSLNARSTLSPLPAQRPASVKLLSVPPAAERAGLLSSLQWQVACLSQWETESNHLSTRMLWAVLANLLKNPAVWASVGTLKIKERKCNNEINITSKKCVL